MLFKKYKWMAATIADMKWPPEALILLVLAAICAGAPAAAQHQTQSPITAVADVSAEDLLARPVGSNWTSYNGDYTGRRYSNLREINVANAAQLRAVWVFHPGNSQSLEVTPVVVDGVMYVTSSNDVFALDARTGRIVWHYQRPVSAGLLDDAAAHKNRGVALWEHFVYVETDDAHLLCLDARSGGLRWDIEYADKTKHYGATSAPLIVKGAVIVGTSGGDSGVRGFLAAYDAVTGKLKWRFWTIPGPGEFGSSSWRGDSYLHGGGTTWMPGTYDPELNTLYWTTSNPAPDFVGDSRPGDDLYTDCVLALNVDTGQLKWYFQFTPHDLFDYDANETPVLADVEQSGSVLRLLIQANRNGFFYLLDRVNGKFIQATPFVEKLNWARSIDGSGRPVVSGRIPTAEGAFICPGIDGATNWFSPSYNPDTRLFYVIALESCNLYFANPKPFAQGQTYYGTGTKLPPDEHAQKILLALSVADGKPVWRYPQAGRGHSWCGTFTTAGGLVFFGDDSGSLEAVDAATGRALWHFNTGQEVRASPMTYAVEGIQYVTVAAGSDVFTFALPR
ncbi:MAG TPA: PQQ-dependent dehydrogenase, methanol/ethanol family [Candidatus Deferrimicrobiaceae bacterium]|nr:PQQ-dependent dehydrogenase, methanol/ethanol family [Candidatus Deferrimicrobiaceae bacterium]